MAEGAAVIEIRRVGWGDAFRRYRVLVDGRECGALRLGGRLVLAHAGGVVRVEARIDWCAAEPLLFRLAPGQRALVEVFNLAGLSGAARGGEVLDPGNWLGLRLVEPGAEALVRAGPWGRAGGASEGEG